MPLLRKINISSGPDLAIWHKTEDLEQLTAIAPWLSGKKKELDAIHLEKRRLEWSCTQILKQELNIEEPVLFYQSGKPYLASDRFISISHGDDLAGIVVGNIPAGIDIQLPNPKIQTISKRFCNAAELENANNSADPLDYLTTIWSAKEAIFKIFGEHVHFSEDISIYPFSPEDRVLRAVIQRSGVELFPRVKHEKLHGHHIVIAWLGNT